MNYGSRLSLRSLLHSSIVRFLVVGVLGLTVDSSLFSVLHSHSVADAPARLISLGSATFVTWRLNRVFTFGASGRPQFIESSRYTLVAIIAQGFNFMLFVALRSLFPDWPALAALLISAAAAAILSFAGQRFFTFARHHAHCRAPA